MRSGPVIRAVVILCVCLVGSQGTSAQLRTENVVLVTLDGARPEEVFGGLDLDVLRSTAPDKPVDALPAYKKYWAATPEERRTKLLPFFWGTLVAKGAIAGNGPQGSAARMTNTHRFSYPGYTEILTGEAHDAEVKSNDPMQNPFETVLEFVLRKRNLTREQVAAFGSWEVLAGIVEHKPGTITSNAGARRWQTDDPFLNQINELQSEVRMPWDRSEEHTSELQSLRH